MYSYPQHLIQVSEWSASHSSHFTPRKEPQCPLNWRVYPRASLDILENRITLDPARNRATDHPVCSLLTYRLSYPTCSSSYIIKTCVNAGHHNSLREVWRGSICDTSITLDIMLRCCLICVCYVVSCDWMTRGDELGRKWEEAVIACINWLGSVNSHGVLV